MTTESQLPQIEEQNPLKAMKIRSQKTARQIAEEIQIDLGEKKRDLTSVTKFIRIGGDKRSLHRAYAKAVSANENEVAEAAEELARQYRQEKKSKNNT